MVTRELGRSDSASILHICSGYDNDCYNDYPAITNQEEIIGVARLLNSLGYEFSRDALTGKHKDEAEAYFSGGNELHSGIHGVIGSVEVLLDWLEQSGGRAISDLKKREAILRGVLHLTDLGNKATIIGMLEFTFEFLDVPDDPYPSEREYIKGSLAAVEHQKGRVFGIIEEAGDILKEIIDAEGLDITKGLQFDNALRRAHQELDSCQRRLDGAKAEITKLIRKTRAVKWFSRVVRALGLVIMWYFIYGQYQTLSISFPSMVIACFASLALSLSLFPSRAHAFHEVLSRLDAKHRVLTEGLGDLRERMKNSSSYRDEMINGSGSDN